MKSNKFLQRALLLLLIGFVATASAAVSEPGSITNYLGVLFSMLKGTAGQLAMALIAIFSGYKAWANSTSTPIIWGAIAIILIAAAPYMAPNLTENVSSYMDLNTSN